MTVNEVAERRFVEMMVEMEFRGLVGRDERRVVVVVVVGCLTL